MSTTIWFIQERRFGRRHRDAALLSEPKWRHRPTSFGLCLRKQGWTAAALLRRRHILRNIQNYPAYDPPDFRTVRVFL